MPLTPYLTEGVFDPPARRPPTLGLVDKGDPLNEIVARRVIEIAGMGERDPQRLSDLVLLALSEDNRIA